MQEVQETQIQILVREDALKKETATCSNTVAWKIPQTEELGGLQSIHGVARVRHNLVTKQQQFGYQKVIIHFQMEGSWKISALLGQCQKCDQTHKHLCMSIFSELLWHLIFYKDLFTGIFFFLICLLHISLSICKCATHAIRQVPKSPG